MAAGSAFVPHSNSRATTSAPHLVASLTQRSPKLPTEATITLSPGFTTLTTAASMAPVPEAAKMTTSFVVW